MRGRILFWSLACVAVLAVACDDEETGGTNNGGDADGGGNGDVSNDLNPGDTGGGDNGGADATADNGGGEDATVDQTPDLPDLGEGCDENSCTGEQACIGGGCVEPVDDIQAYVDAAEENPASYWHILQLPALFVPAEPCCFDYNGDGRIDDGLGSLLGVLDSFLGGGESSVDIQGTINESLADGTITLVTEWRELPETEGDVKFSIFVASNDVDGNGDLDNTLEERVNGEGTYALDPVGFGDHGSQVQFNLGTLEDESVFAGPSTFNLSLNIEALGDEPFNLTLVDARVLLPITVEANGIHTVDQERGAGEEAYTAGGGQLGGVLEADQLLGFLDSQFRACECAGVNPDEAVLTWEIDQEEGELVVACTDNTGDNASACGDEDGPLCGNIGTVCGFVSLVGGLLDVDRDNDGIDDSMSAGLRFGLTGATINGLTEDINGGTGEGTGE